MTYPFIRIQRSGFICIMEVEDLEVMGELTYHWEFGDNNTSEQAKPTHVYQAPGSYEISVLVEEKLPGDVVNHHQLKTQLQLEQNAPTQAEDDEKSRDVGGVHIKKERVNN